MEDDTIEPQVPDEDAEEFLRKQREVARNKAQRVVTFEAVRALFLVLAENGTLSEHDIGRITELVGNRTESVEFASVFAGQIEKEAYRGLDRRASWTPPAED